ncbi:DarT ssDNA thymidine ADP-ribosyltransferase family protein [Bosea sp. ANAM02]|uniref:DarT ssDNA thymidine ADP-ribosyltransferase family protein n=1 Tax=Bosea sp. ANAM02 TaxID=2020412 RepID=UPI00140EBB08|nr:DarT ssDNA thymidine ADP-ribosyltransferase family protein [Bosea sp. ANAM02]BCB19213.1 hypothetical protein OCUBac02_21070 [Bosea sp. ANAM02]
MDYRQRIQREARRRGIQYLMHFTQTANLSSIVEYGLLSRADLARRGLCAFGSAPHRLDDEDEAISVSISAINNEMFKAKQNTVGRAAWVFLFLDPSILWTRHCRFCSRSAAKKEIKEHRGRLDGPWGFAQMFSDSALGVGSQATSYRVAQGIADCEPTYRDAEVQVFERIAPELIIHAWTDRLVTAECVQSELNRLPGYERAVSVQEF